jgi:glycosyltransferase involved in cell wall biosynthesis
MNILFLTLAKIDTLNSRGIYTDLMRKFIKEGHSVCIVSPLERYLNQKTKIIYENDVKILKVKTLNIFKANIIEKGIAIILLEYQFKKSVKQYFKDITFDLILYSTPPITLTKTVKEIKRRDKSVSYLLLKDIFPQNAVDIGMMSRRGLLHSLFRKKEKILYQISDYIGCMSLANVEYIKKYNPEIPEEKIEVCPNSIELVDKYLHIIRKSDIRKKYNIPEDMTVFIYGGNLGKPQGLDFLLTVLQFNKKREDIFFVICGSGTEYLKIENYLNNNKIDNVLLLSQLSKEKYDELAQSCDVGLIFLNKKFTIPNYPSRLLSYLEYKMPILAATDINTDLGKIAEKNQYGFWCKNGDINSFNKILDKYTNNKEIIQKMGLNGYNYLINNYTVDISYNVIMKHFI